MVNLANKLALSNDVEIVLLNKEGKFLTDLQPNIKVFQADKKLKVFGVSSRDSKSKGLLFFLKRNLFALKRKHSKTEKWIENYVAKTKINYNCDVAIAYTDDAFVMDLVLEKVSAGRKFVFYHSDFRNKRFKNDDYVNRATKFDKYICVSRSCKEITDICCPKLSNITDYLYNSVKISNEIEPFEYDDSYFNILTVARVSYEKRIDWGIEIVSKLVDNGFKVRYYICGNGKDFEKNKNLVKELKKEDNIFFLGEQKNPYNYIKNSDLILLLSKTESFGISLIEGFKLGVPCLTTNTISAKEIVGNYGYVCEHDKELIYNKLREILKDKSDLNKKKSDLKKYQFDNEENIRRFLEFCE